jgi:hypothetical protein
MKIYIDAKKSGHIYYMEKDAFMRVKINSGNIVNFRDAEEIDISKLDKKSQQIYQKIKMELMN